MAFPKNKLIATTNMVNKWRARQSKMFLRKSKKRTVAKK